MNLQDIYSEYKVGSQGFVIAVETHCGFEISRDEIERIAAKSPDAATFENVWENDDDWSDDNNS